ncbi:MAG: Stp1/IreP family PP2C-type Ser/Thr phosphatase [bacterium]|nr:Stp1/IreP family PP2C-type Ser/Thr phosphatase [bacterium]
MSEAEKRIRLRGGFSTSTGQIRENNEDNLHLWLRDSYALAIVADGMGGAAAGEEASRLAVESVQDGMIALNPPALDSMSDEAVGDRMKGVIRTANTVIVNRAAANPELRGMGTTATLAFVRGANVIVAHVGDSRAYLIEHRTQQVTQITADHSFVEALVAAGHLTQEQAEDHPMKNVLYRALGQNEDIDVDVYESRLHAGDRLVLCSDGLTRHVRPGEIAEIVLAYEEPTEAAQKLVDRANALGGEDNISAVVILVEGLWDDEATLELKMLSTLPNTLPDEDTLLLRMLDDDTRRGVPRYVLETPAIPQPPAGTTQQTLEAKANPPPAEPLDGQTAATTDGADDDPSKFVGKGGEGRDPSLPPQ